MAFGALQVHHEHVKAWCLRCSSCFLGIRHVNCLAHPARKPKPKADEVANLYFELFAVVIAHALSMYTKRGTLHFVRTITARDLNMQLKNIVEGVAAGEVTLVTHKSKPVAVLLPIDDVAYEKWLVAQGPDFVASGKSSD